MNTQETNEQKATITVDGKTFDMPVMVMVPDEATFADGDFLEDALLERMLNTQRDREEFADMAGVTIGIRWKKMGGKDRGKSTAGADQQGKSNPPPPHGSRFCGVGRCGSSTAADQSGRNGTNPAGRGHPLSRIVSPRL
jgi:hypothetical protein